MFVKVTTAENTIECFQTDSYLISSVKNFSPFILKVEVFAGNRRIARRKRFFCWWYKNITFKSAKIQNLIKKNEKETEDEQSKVI